MSPLRLRNTLGLLKTMYRDAVLDRLVGTSPCVRISIPSYEKERVVPLTVEQVQKLVATIQERNRAMVVVQAMCGL